MCNGRVLRWVMMGNFPAGLQGLSCPLQGSEVPHSASLCWGPLHPGMQEASFIPATAFSPGFPLSEQAG